MEVMDMREIKFRAWVQRMDGTGYMKPDSDVCQNFYEHREDSVLMQFTGVKDRDGVDIFESDVLECEMGNLWRSGFKHGAFTSHVLNDPFDWCFLDDYNFKVVGNVHENPELLK